MSPLVSVVLPTQNRADRLEGAIASVLAQTVADLELIVVDDASTDSTPELLMKASDADPRVRVIRRDRSEGPSPARNTAIRQAAGEFLAFIDDDDRWHPEKTASQLEALAADTSLGAVTCFYESFDERTGRGDAFRGATGYSQRALLWSNFPASILGLVNRSRFSQDLFFDETLTTCEDWDLFLRCAEERRIDTVPRVLSRVVFHGSGLQSAYDRERRTDGRAAFIAKHEHKMTDDCRRYHQVRLRLIREASGGARIGLYARYLATLPPRLSTIVSGETLAAKVGRVMRDPGLGPRTLLRLLGRNL
jgi:glycosyltransferase involved in cell wall biosynthesis